MVVGVKGPTGDWTPLYVPFLPNLSEAQYDPSPPWWQEWPGACDPPNPLASLALAGLKQHCDSRVRQHWRPHSEDRSLLLRPSKRAPCRAAAFPHSITLGTGCFLCLLSIFTDTLHPHRGGKGPGRTRLPLPSNPALLLLINVYSQHQTH